jgi:hypothetical protein
MLQFTGLSLRKKVEAMTRNDRLGITTILGIVITIAVTAAWLKFFGGSTPLALILVAVWAVLFYRMRVFARDAGSDKHQKFKRE